jgi:ribonucleoside-triphosphate reductase
MNLKVEKRKGEIVDFDKTKIYSAISRAVLSNQHPVDDVEVVRMTESIVQKIEEKSEENKIDTWKVEDIQDVVISVIMDYGYSDLAVDYIRYRERRNIARNSEIDALGLINDYIDENSPNHDMAVHENASTNFSIQGLHQYLFESVIKKKWLNLFGDEIKKAYDKGFVHLHDLGYLGCYCGGWDLKQLLTEGFCGVDEKLTSKPPKHFDVALMQALNFLFTLQGEFAGAQAFSNFNTLLAPFVAKDDLTYKQVKNEIRKFIFNLNVSTRVGFQAPFTNLTLDMDVTKTKLAEEPVIIGGEPDFEHTYGEYQKEAQWINQAIVEVFDEGDKNRSGFSYPICTLCVTDSFPWDSKLGESILKLTVKYGNFYFSNYINSDFSESDIKSMCCRLRINKKQVSEFLDSQCSGGLDEEDYEKTHQKGHSYFGAAENTGSLFVGTINLVAIMNDVVMHHTDHVWQYFLDELKHYMDITAEASMIRRKVVENFCELGLYPYTKYWLRHVKERTGHYFSQHFSTICPNGFHEAMIVYGKEKGMDDPSSWKLAEEMLKFMKDYSIELQKRHHVLFNIEQSPAESAGVKLCQKSGISPNNENYYTNSTWFPADSETDLFDIIKVQSKLNEYYTGGSVLHIYEDSDMTNYYKDIKKIIVYTFSETRLPFLTISPVYSVCPTHGRIAGIVKNCPHCGKELISYSRVCGYYRPIKNMNEGRRRETMKRHYFKFSSFEDITKKYEIKEKEKSSEEK